MGRVVVDDPAVRFDVSPQTLRKDLNDPCEQRLMARLPRGAMLVSGVGNSAYAVPWRTSRKSASPPAALIPDGSSLFINGGVTIEIMARALVSHRTLWVVTDNIHVISTLRPSRGGPATERTA